VTGEEIAGANQVKIILAEKGLSGNWENATLRNITDSDLLDAKTNRKGWAIYGARNLYKHVDFKVTLFDMDVLDKDIFLATGDSDAERLRLQTDIVLKF